MLLDRSAAATTPLATKATPLSDQIQSRALWRLRASLAETESFSDVIRMEHFASSPEVPSSMASFESNATPMTASDRRAGLRGDGDGTVRAANCQFEVTTMAAFPPPPPAIVSAGSGPSCSSETRRQAFRRAIARRWTAAKFDVDRRPQTSFDSMETDGDVSDTSCRPEMTTTSFDSTTTTTTTTTTDNTDDVHCGVQEHRSQHDSGYRSVEVHVCFVHCTRLHKGLGYHAGLIKLRRHILTNIRG